MLSARVDFQLLEHCVAERPFGQHSLDCYLQRPSREPRLHLGERSRIDPARVGAMAIIGLGLALVPRYPELAGVDDDNIVTGVDVRRKLRLVFPAQSACDFGGKSPEQLAAAKKKRNLERLR